MSKLIYPNKSSNCDMADWFELKVLEAEQNTFEFSKLRNFIEEEIDEDEIQEDIGIHDASVEEIIGKIAAEIKHRMESLEDAYPFQWINESQSGLAKSPVINISAKIYLFCLFLSHWKKSNIYFEKFTSTISDDVVRKMFQCFSNISAAGLMRGGAYSFGWPRPDSTKLLEAAKLVCSLTLPHS